MFFTYSLSVYVVKTDATTQTAGANINANKTLITTVSSSINDGVSAIYYGGTFYVAYSAKHTGYTVAYNIWMTTSTNGTTWDAPVSLTYATVSTLLCRNPYIVIFQGYPMVFHSLYDGTHPSGGQYSIEGINIGMGYYYWAVNFFGATLDDFAVVVTKSGANLYIICGGTLQGDSHGSIVWECIATTVSGSQYDSIGYGVAPDNGYAN